MPSAALDYVRRLLKALLSNADRERGLRAPAMLDARTAVTVFSGNTGAGLAKG